MVFAGVLEYAQVARRVGKVRVMLLEYAPRISGTRHGFRVHKGMRRCYMVCVIVLGCAPGLYRVRAFLFIFNFFSRFFFHSFFDFLNFIFKFFHFPQ